VKNGLGQPDVELREGKHKESAVAVEGGHDNAVAAEHSLYAIGWSCLKLYSVGVVLYFRVSE
jgi:hypothetical protein